MYPPGTPNPIRYPPNPGRQWRAEEQNWENLTWACTAACPEQLGQARPALTSNFLAATSGPSELTRGPMESTRKLAVGLTGRDHIT